MQLQATPRCGCRLAVAALLASACLRASTVSAGPVPFQSTAINESPSLTPAEAALRTAQAELMTDDCDTNGLPQDCTVDCNTNGSPDDLDLFRGMSLDCNANRLPDECDVASGESRDCNANNVPDECDGIPRADIDCDGDVDATDFVAWRACHPLPGRPTPPGCDGADINRDGRVDCADWRILRDAWTAGPPPMYARCRPASAVTPAGGG